MKVITAKSRIFERFIFLLQGESMAIMKREEEKEKICHPSPHILERTHMEVENLEICFIKTICAHLPFGTSFWPPSAPAPWHPYQGYSYPTSLEDILHHLFIHKLFCVVYVINLIIWGKVLNTLSYHQVLFSESKVDWLNFQLP